MPGTRVRVVRGFESRDRMDLAGWGLGVGGWETPGMRV